MISERVRPRWTAEQMVDIYKGPHDARVLYPGQQLRVETVIDVARRLVTEPDTVADLACGNGEQALSVGAKKVILGDFAPGYEIQGPIEKTIEQIQRVDLFICAETFEHLWDPARVMRQIKTKTKAMVCTVPVTPEEGQNGEHYWSFDREGFEAMLNEAGWDVVIYEEVDASPSVVFTSYRCGVWGVVHDG